MSSKQDEIYAVLKKHNGAKFKISHLAVLFKCAEVTMRTVLGRMYKKKEGYPGFDRKYSSKISKNGREFLCHVYFVKEN